MTSRCSSAGDGLIDDVSCGAGGGEAFADPIDQILLGDCDKRDPR